MSPRTSGDAAEKEKHMLNRLYDYLWPAATKSGGDRGHPLDYEMDRTIDYSNLTIPSPKKGSDFDDVSNRLDSVKYRFFLIVFVVEKLETYLSTNTKIINGEAEDLQLKSIEAWSLSLFCEEWLHRNHPAHRLYTDSTSTDPCATVYRKLKSFNAPTPENGGAQEVVRFTLEEARQLYKICKGVPRPKTVQDGLELQPGSGEENELGEGEIEKMEQKVQSKKPTLTNPEGVPPRLPLPPHQEPIHSPNQSHTHNEQDEPTELSTISEEEYNKSMAQIKTTLKRSLLFNKPLALTYQQLSILQTFYKRIIQDPVSLRRLEQEILDHKTWDKVLKYILYIVQELPHYVGSRDGGRDGEKEEKGELWGVNGYQVDVVWSLYALVKAGLAVGLWKQIPGNSNPKMDRTVMRRSRRSQNRMVRSRHGQNRMLRRLRHVILGEEYIGEEQEFVKLLEKGALAVEKKEELLKKKGLAMTQKNVDLQCQMDDLLRLKEEKEAEHAGKIREMMKMKKKLEDELSQSIDDGLKARESHARREDGLRDELAEKSLEVESMRSGLDKARTGAEKVKKSAEKEIQKVRHAIDKKGQDIEDLKKELEIWKLDHEEIEKRLEKVNGVVEEKTKEAETFRRERDALKVSLSRATAKAQGNEKDLQIIALKKEIEGLRKEMTTDSETSLTVEQLWERVRGLEVEKNKLEAKGEGVEGRISVLEKGMVVLQEEIALLNRRFEKLGAVFHS